MQSTKKAGSANVDGRTRDVRRFKTHVEELLSSGASTPAQRILVRRAAMLACKLEDLEAAELAGKKINLEIYAQTVGTLGRTLDRLGIADEPPKQLVKLRLPYGFEGKLTQEQREAFAKSRTQEQKAEWLSALPDPLLNEILILNNMKPIAERRQDARPEIIDHGYKPPEGEELAYLKSRQAVAEAIAAEAANPLKTPEALAALAQLAKVLT